MNLRSPVPVAEKARGPQLRFDGNVAGLSAGAPGALQQSASGDRNDAMNYSLICSCGHLLSILGAIKPNADGARSSYCTVCGHATCVSKDGQILFHKPWDLATNKART